MSQADLFFRTSAHVTAGLLSLVLIGCSGSVDVNFVGEPGGEGGERGEGVCGDGAVDATEACDDSNVDEGDGCSASCEREEGFTCDNAEPTECAPHECGNDEEEGDEECDDGNVDDGDGCSAECLLETDTTCGEVTAISLEPDDDGHSGEASATIEAEGGLVPAGPCEGSDDVGSGADRIFSFATNSELDLDVRVTANLDTVVRIMSSACDLESEVACADDGGVSEEELISIPNAAAGTYFVVVDGADDEQEGSVTVNVAARCPLSGIKIDKVVLSSTARRTVLFNANSSCGVDLSRLGVRAQPAASNTPNTLDGTTLAALGKLTLTSEEPTPAGQLFHGSLTYDSTSGGAYYICRGSCNSSGSDVLDAVRFSGLDGPPAAAPPTEVNFDGSLAQLMSPEVRSYFRVAYEGSFPDFVMADYVDAYFVDTFEDRQVEDYDESGNSLDALFAELEGSVGSSSLHLSGGGQGGDGLRRRFRNHAGAITAVQPTEISFQVQAAAVNRFQGAFYIGDDGSGFESTFLQLFLSNAGTVCVGGNASCASGGIVGGPYAADTWAKVLINNFDYSSPPNYAAELTVDDGMPVSISGVSAGAEQLYLGNPASASVHLDQIVIR